MTMEEGEEMRIILFLSIVVFAVAFACNAGMAADQFSDDFERKDNDRVGNDWLEEEDDGIQVALEGGEVLIQGTQDVDWDRDGIRREVDDVQSVFFDYMANDSFSIHLRIDDARSGAFIEAYAPPGGAFQYASSFDGGWLGWTQAGGSNPAVGYSTLGIVKEDFHFQVIHKGLLVVDILNENFSSIDEVFISVDSAVGTVGSAHIDNVSIDEGVPDVAIPGKGAIVDDFDRPDSDNLGKDWTEEADAGVIVSIEDNEVLIQGTQTVDWTRTGLRRQLDDAENIFFDYLANDNFNVHVRIDDALTSAYIEFYAPPGSGFQYASSEDGAWPGWVPAGGNNPNTGEYSTLGIIRVSKGKYEFSLNDDPIMEIKNSELTKIGSVFISVDSAAGTVGSMHVDNVMIDAEDVRQQAVSPRGKATATWGRVKGNLK